MERLLHGKVAVITGGTAGIGKGIAEKFAAQGASVVIIGTNTERGETALGELKAISSAEQIPAFYALDVSKTADVEKVVGEILAAYGKIDILVNNAGITRDQLLMKMQEADWDDVLAVNVKSCYNTCRYVIRSMMKARHGKIINVSSVVGITGNAGQTNYGASKAAMIGFSKSLAKEVASRNVNVNVIAPGFTETKMTKEMGESAADEILGRIPFGRMGTTEDIANSALFLASSLADYITGQVVVVDGGLSI